MAAATAASATSVGTFSLTLTGNQKPFEIQVNSTTKVTDIIARFQKEANSSVDKATEMTFKDTLMPYGFQELCTTFSKVKKLTLQDIPRADVLQLESLFAKDDYGSEGFNYGGSLSNAERRNADTARVFGQIFDQSKKTFDKRMGLVELNFRACKWLTITLIHQVWRTFATTLSKMDFTGSTIYEGNAIVGDRTAKYLFFSDAGLRTQLHIIALSIEVYDGKKSVLKSVEGPSGASFAMANAHVSLLAKSVNDNMPLPVVDMLATAAATATATSEKTTDQKS